MTEPWTNWNTVEAAPPPDPLEVLAAVRRILDAPGETDRSRRVRIRQAIRLIDKVLPDA